MLYPLVRPIATIGLQVYFRKIFLSNADHIPHDKPVLLAANHPTAFFEPCILACFLHEPLHFLVRGDFFAKPLFNFLLRQLHMLPVFRQRDRGFSYLKENYATFEACFDALQQHKTIMILAEGRSIYEKRLRPIQKGTARIAFGTMEKYPDIEDVWIVPVGVTYTQADRFRSDVMINVGEPFSVRDIWEAHRDNHAEGHNLISRRLAEDIAAEMLIIENPADDETCEMLLKMYRSSHEYGYYPTLSTREEPLRQEQRVLAKFHQLDDADKEVCRETVLGYKKPLEDAGLTDAAVAGYNYYRWWISLTLLVLLPVFLLGFVLNALPLYLARWIADAHVKHIEFYGPVKGTVGIFAYFFWWLGWLIAAVVTGHGWLYELVVVMLISGFIALFYRDILLRWKASRKWKKFNNKGMILSLRARVSEVLGYSL